MSRIRVLSERHINDINPENNKGEYEEKKMHLVFVHNCVMNSHRPYPIMGILTYFLGLHSELINPPQIELFTRHRGSAFIISRQPSNNTSA